MRLSELKTGDSAIIVKVLGHGAFRKRMIEMGFVKGRVVDVVLDAPLKDPVKYGIMGYEISLRRSEAQLVEVLPVEDVEYWKCKDALQGVGTVCDNDSLMSLARERSREITVALIGNPNCGKTSLFNVASGAREHVRSEEHTSELQSR